VILNRLFTSHLSSSATFPWTFRGINAPLLGRGWLVQSLNPGAFHGTCQHHEVAKLYNDSCILHLIRSQQFGLRTSTPITISRTMLYIVSSPRTRRLISSSALISRRQCNPSSPRTPLHIRPVEHIEATPLSPNSTNLRHESKSTCWSLSIGRDL
jgi:hypothetical protein